MRMWTKVISQTSLSALRSSGPSSINYVTWPDGKVQEFVSIPKLHPKSPANRMKTDKFRYSPFACIQDDSSGLSSLCPSTSYTNCSLIFAWFEAPEKKNVERERQNLSGSIGLQQLTGENDDSSVVGKKKNIDGSLQFNQNGKRFAHTTSAVEQCSKNELGSNRFLVLLLNHSARLLAHNQNRIKILPLKNESSSPKKGKMKKFTTTALAQQNRVHEHNLVRITEQTNEHKSFLVVPKGWATKNWIQSQADKSTTTKATWILGLCRELSGELNFEANDHRPNWSFI